MSLWIIKGSDFVDALIRAFQEHDPANLDYLMTEFSIADYGVTKRQKIKFINGAWSEEAPKAARRSGCRLASKGYEQILTLIRNPRLELIVIFLGIFSIATTKLPASELGTDLTKGALSARSALENENFGLFPAKDFRVTTGQCNNCPTSKQARWYFRDDIIAVPNKGFSAAGFVADSPGYKNVLHRLQELGPQTHPLNPSLIWLGSPEIISVAILSNDGKTLRTRDGQEIPFSLVPKISSNRSYYNASSIEFFRRRSLRIRGVTHSQNDTPGFVARTIWPEDFSIRANNLPREPLRNVKNVSQLITDGDGGAKGSFEPRLLWEHSDLKERTWTGLPVLGLVLSGAQGDDDESQAGHLAVVTGKVGANGEIADWMVNNFYNLDEVSEKGIIASMLPLDNYLTDLNSGQSYYRPTYLLVAVLKDSRAASRFQAAIQPLYNHFYRHDFLYHHSKVNCTGISIDTLRAIGWRVPNKGATSYLKAAAAFVYLSVTERSLASGKKMFDYLSEEQTRLFPRAAFETDSEDLLAILDGPGERSKSGLTDYERALRNDALAVLFIRIPQLPSSRAFGTYPIASFNEYRNRVPADRSKWKIVPVDARPFPEHLKEPLAGESRAISWVLIAIFTLVVLGILWRLVPRNRSHNRKLLLNSPSFLPKNKT
jgi:hypothetical protein